MALIYVCDECSTEIDGEYCHHHPNAVLSSIEILKQGARPVPLHTTLTIAHHQNPHARTEAQGRNGWFQLARLEVWLQEKNPATPEVAPRIHVEGYASRSTDRAPVHLEFVDPHELRQFAEMLTQAATHLEEEQNR